MREIVACIQSPCTLIAKWLVNEINTLPKFESCSIKNSIELTKLLESVTFADDDVMVLFDVESLFPSIPLRHALSSLKSHLIKHNIPREKVEVYMNAAEMCMSMNYFEYRSSFFKIESGTSMGNPLSPLIAEAFMSKFEIELKAKQLMPTFWKRYVDDVLTIVKRSEVENSLSILNEQYDEINFTYEIEENCRLVFLDLELQRINNKVEIAIHHKNTNTLRFIPSDSYTPIQYKLAAFNSLAHRLVSLPLSTKNYLKEYNYIRNAAEVNGYNQIIIDKIIHRHSIKRERSNLSTLFSQNKSKERDKKRATLTFVPEITNTLKTSFRKNEIKPVFSNPFKLKNILTSTKDKRETLDRSGIYEITCNECDKKYYGQTKRSVRTRFKEHKNNIKNNEVRKSAFAMHAIEEQHLSTTIDNVRLLKCLHDSRKLDAFESLYIHRNAAALNADMGNIESELFML